MVWDVGYRGREAAKQRPAVRCEVRCVEVWRYKVHLQMRRWRPWEGMCWLDKLGGGSDSRGRGGDVYKEAIWKRPRSMGRNVGERPDAWTVPKVTSADFDTLKPTGEGYDGFDGWAIGKGQKSLG